MGCLDGKVAVVTGGSRGLGREIALGFAREGADVVVASRSREACDAVADEVRCLGRTALAVACHLGRWDEADRLAATAYDELGRIDVLVSNAGISPPFPSPASMTEEQWDKVIGVNLKGPFRLGSVVAERMAAGDGGSIVFVSSVGAQRPQPFVAAYCAAKAAINNVTGSLAHAYGPAVRVNAIQPGPFLTDMSRHWDMAAFEQQAASFALRRGGRPDEIVGTALYLASDASSFTTGAVVPVDGGYA